MEYADYYATLGVPKTASAAEIRSAFRRLARQHHPDVSKNPGAAERFKRINEAHQVLSDPAKRAKYDQLGADWERIEREGAYARSYAGRGAAPAEGFGDFSDFFRTFFGGGGEFRWPVDEPAAAAPRDIESELEVTLEEAARGGRRTIQMEVPQSCPTCQGRGSVRSERRLRGRVVMEARPCPTCSGEGVVAERKKLDVTIPAGVTNGSRVRVRGKGGGAAAVGDLYLRVKLLPHSTFTVEGRDLRCRLLVRDYDAVLGAELTVPTLNGSVQMRVPPLTPGGKVFRLRGKGLPALQGGTAGDLYAVVDLALPGRITDEARGLYQKLRSLDQPAVRS